MAIVYVSHKMDEIFRIADRITVLRDGETVGTRVTAETSSAEIIRMMVGRELNDQPSAAERRLRRGAAARARPDHAQAARRFVRSAARRGAGRRGPGRLRTQ